tara:strand:- start:126 stop:392 length:267 start_codon:yes stop_codon:yes gene_type:complete
MSKRKLTNRLRITNGISFVIILILLIKIVDLSDKNNRLEEKSKKEVMKNAEIVDQYFDLQFEYEKAFEELLRLEEIVEYEISADSTRQ